MSLKPTAVPTEIPSETDPPVPPAATSFPDPDDVNSITGSLGSPSAG
jgi:hypothetical protein